MAFAFVVGIEKYLDSSISPVRFAKNDAAGFEAALTELGCDSHRIILLTDSDATKTVIESKLSQAIKLAAKNDLFYFFYAGHGFSSEGINYITCYDTQKNDLKNTSLRLQRIFDDIRGSTIKCAVLFVDACHSGMNFGDTTRVLLAQLNDVELQEFFKNAEGCACFSACREDEQSFSHPSLKHGVWSFHIIKALMGEAKTAIERNAYITVESLQNYLAQDVPLSVRKLYTTTVTQTPWLMGSLSRSFVVADISPILRKKIRVLGPLESVIAKAEVTSVRFVPVKSLSGFVTGSHRVPNSINSATRSFVEKIAEGDIQRVAEDTFGALKKNFGYKRKEIQVDVDGAAVDIITPHFDYHCSISLREDNPSEAEIYEFVDNISDGQIVLSEQFSQAFSDGFQAVVFTFNKAISVEELVDQLEELSSQEFTLDYDKACTYCQITAKDFNARIKIESRTISILVDSRIPPKNLFVLASAGLAFVGEKRLLSVVPLLTA